MSDNFKLENYETVKERKKRFYSDHPEGAIIVEIQNLNSINEYALFKATIYLDKEDQSKGIIKSTGHAHETRDIELSVNKYGKKYASVNYSAWVENCEESAIGRALDNAGYAGNNKCSREEIIKVQNAEERTKIDPAIEYDNALALIALAKDIKDLQKCGLKIASLTGITEEQKEHLRELYKERKADIDA